MGVLIMVMVYLVLARCVGMSIVQGAHFSLDV
jgi:hypothetical protein